MEAALSRLLYCSCHPVVIGWVMRSSKTYFITSLVVGYCTETMIKKHGRPLTRVISVPYNKVGETGVPLRGQSRELVCRVRDYFQRDKINKGLILPVEKVIERTAGALEIGKNTVLRIGKEKIQSEQSGLKLNTPDKKYSRFEPVTELDAFQKEMPSTAMSKDSS
ncbi:hypothetical protein J6590_078667 [Homalodisca vitripennis]|nr:hypothetical protein J6590_078667 [Homalodisca vitripennis]